MFSRGPPVASLIRVRVDLIKEKKGFLNAFANHEVMAVIKLNLLINILRTIGRAVAVLSNRCDVENQKCSLFLFHSCSSYKSTFSVQLEHGYNNLIP